MSEQAIDRAANAIVLELDCAHAQIRKLETILTSERQRREECEAVLREVAHAPNRIAENSRIIAAYFGEWN